MSSAFEKKTPSDDDDHHHHHRRRRRWMARCYFVVLFSASFSSTTESSCPAACFCNTPSKIVYCSRRGLTAIPPGIAPDTLQLNLNANSFHSTTLLQANFTGYRILEHLYLSECGIERIEVGTFALLAGLKWLDLSNNRIRTLSASSLSGLNLQHLFLNGNRHVRLVPESFQGLVTTGLYLHDCSLVRLEPDVLAPLNSSLRYLWLNGNEIGRIEVRFAGIFATLHHLRLASNPLHCSCEVLWLKEFFDRSGDVFKGAVAPSCLTPHRLRGKFFGQLSVADFRCQPPMFNNIETTFGRNTGRLKCTASGDPAPVLYWIQPSGKTAKYGPDENDEETGRTEGVLTLQNDEDGGTNLFGMYICIANNDAGNVTLTINVSWPLLGNADSPQSLSLPPPFPSDSVSMTTTTPSLDEGTSSWWWRRGITTPAAASQPPTEGPPSTPVASDSGRLGGGGASRLHGAREQNYTVVVDLSHPPPSSSVIPRSRLFTVTELVCAVVGTHLATLVVCLAAVPIYYRARWSATARKNRLSSSGPPQRAPEPGGGGGGYARPRQQLLRSASPQFSQQRDDRTCRQVAPPSDTAYPPGGGRINDRFLTDYFIASG